MTEPNLFRCAEKLPRFERKTKINEDLNMVMNKLEILINRKSKYYFSQLMLVFPDRALIQEMGNIVSEEN